MNYNGTGDTSMRKTNQSFHPSPSGHFNVSSLVREIGATTQTHVNFTYEAKLSKLNIILNTMFLWVTRVKYGNLKHSSYIN